MLSIENLHFKRGERVLFERLSFTLEPGQTLYVLGANGSGKSTLLKLIGGLLAGWSGRISWNGDSIADLAGAYRQDYLWLGEQMQGMKPELSVQENVQYMCTMMGIRPPPNNSETWAVMGLDSLRNTPLSRLSSGEQQRVGLLPLLSASRVLWILDEPTSSLDNSASALIDRTLVDHASQGGINICATHKIPDQMPDYTRYLNLSPNCP